MNKNRILPIVIILIASSLITGKASSAADSAPKPSGPEFTVRFVNASYSVTETNPYTGMNETKLVSNDSIEVAIKNQPIDVSNGYVICFNVRAKPHFEGNWTEIYPLENRTSIYNGDGTFSFAEYVSHDSPAQSNSTYTVIAFPVVPTELYQASGYDVERYYTEEGEAEGMFFAFLSAIPYDGQVDFQVEALVGHGAQVFVNDHPLAPYPIGHYGRAIAFDMASGWSNSQTIRIGGATSEAIPPPSESSINTWGALQTELVIGIIIVVVLLVTVSVVHWKKRKS